MKKKVLAAGILLSIGISHSAYLASAESESITTFIESSTREEESSSQSQMTTETTTSDTVESSATTQSQVPAQEESTGQEEANLLFRNSELKVTIDKAEISNGRFKIILSPVTPRAIKRIVVPIWCDSNQRDLKWYEAKKQANGTYVVDFDYNNHGFNTGMYKIHIYTTTTDNNTKAIAIPSIPISQPKNVNTIFKASPTNNYSSYRLSLTLENPNVKGITFPTWSSKNGQDDIRWYKGSYDSKNKQWYVDFPLSNHKDVGDMTTHTYIESSKGAIFLRGNSYTVPKLEFTSTNVEKTNKIGQFKVTIQVNQPERVEKILVPIWSNRNGQDDIKWYEAKKQNNGTYSLMFDYKDHKFDSGKYHVHAYIQSTGNQSVGTVISNDVMVDDKNIKGEISVVSKNSTNSSYRMELKLNTSAKSVILPTWTLEKGQDDIKWYEGKYDSKKDVWYTDIDVKNHKSGGATMTHAYITTSKQLLATHTTFTIAKPELVDKQIDMSQAESGKLKITINVKDPQNVEKIQVPTWSAKNGQDDLKWYEAQKQSNGSFVLNFDHKNHNYETGRYLMHAYIHNKNGTSSGLVISNDILLPEFKLNAKDLKIEAINSSKSIYRISLNMPNHSRIKRVVFPTWTTLNGQDDIKWHAASYRNNVWSVDVDIRKNHFNGTRLMTHAYADITGQGMVGLGAATADIPETAISHYVNHRGNHRNAPENSIPSFEQADFFGVETDIRLTADKKWVIMHDDTIDRMTNGSGYVERMTLNQIRKYRFDAGNGVNKYPANKLVVPTLEEYLAICKNKGIIPVVEVKINNASETDYNNLVATLRKYGFGEKLKIISFFLEPLQTLKRKMPEISTLYLTGDISDTTIAQAKSVGDRSGLNIVWANVTSAKVNKAKAQGLTVGAWTVPANQFNNMKNAGVDYITTDD